jgi:hypothetical protein
MQPVGRMRILHRCAVVHREQLAGSMQEERVLESSHYFSGQTLTSWYFSFSMTSRSFLKLRAPQASCI